LWIRLLALLTNIRLGCKGLPGTNTLSEYKNPQITASKSFIVQDHVLFSPMFGPNKLDRYITQGWKGWLGQALKLIAPFANYKGKIKFIAVTYIYT
jgi:hypothetical protein